MVEFKLGDTFPPLFAPIKPVKPLGALALGFKGDNAPLLEPA